MTSLDDLITEFDERGEKIFTAVAAFKRRAKKDKTVEYKKRRLNELAVLWQEFSDKANEIEAEPTRVLAQVYYDAKQSYEEAYNWYTDELNKITIPTVDPNTNTDVAKAVKIQENRMDMARRLIEHIETKINTGEQPSVAFAALKMRKLEELWAKLENGDEELAGKNPPVSYTDMYNDIETEIDGMLLTLQEIQQPPTTPQHTNFDGGLKLNRVEIPKFQGDYFKWVTFRDLFTSMVMDNKSLSKAQKMQVLKTHVTGEAETLIRDLTISEVNFDSAWGRLLGRYDNNRVVVYKLINKVITQSMSKGDSKSMKKLLDTTDQVMLALSNLGRPTNKWDDWLVVIITQKLPEDSHKDWEKRVSGSTELPTWEQLKKFMEEQFRMMEQIEHNTTKTEGRYEKGKYDKGKFENRTYENRNKQIKTYQASVIKTECPACDADHPIFECPKWKKMEIQGRWEIAKKKKFCFLCLKVHKDQLSCDRPKPCKKCDKKHSTWLHEEKGKEITNAHCVISYQKEPDILLATALIMVRDISGKNVPVRALIDSGSQGSMITERAANVLQLKQCKTNVTINGIGNHNSGFARRINITISPRFDSTFRMELECYILKTLTKTLPDYTLDVSQWNHIKDLVWADPRFNIKGPVDLLLGMDAIVEIIKPGLIRGTIGQPVAQDTYLGWTVSGKIAPQENKHIKCLMATQGEKHEDLSRFWELEELQPKRILTAEEAECEAHYVATHRRNDDGTYTVKIPFKTGELGPDRLGASRGQCMARFLQLEKRLNADKTLSLEYKKGMNEYIELGHMKDVTQEPSNTKLYYIPHHAVIKLESLTTKTRIVFDASAKTTTGISLNECMHTGAKQQPELLDILLKWRKHKVVFKADIEKMYRQIRLDDDDQRYHTILWRNDPSEEIREFQLTTATFGTGAAPFMATRSLNQTATDNQIECPKAVEVIKKDFYVDDCISGADNITEAVEIKNQVLQALGNAGLKLRKWTSNNQEFLNTLPDELTEKSLQTFDDEDVTKALGLQWNPKSDNFSFKVNWITDEKPLTKRQLLSEASKLFDPLGWLAPVIVTAKIIMQKVWMSKIDWDDEVPEQIKKEWVQFRGEIPKLASVSIPRWLNYETGCKVTIHGFGDASETAYAAVIYTRIETKEDVKIQMVMAKTRVAPIKTRVSLPKLELCAAVLVGQLITTVKNALGLADAKTYAWSDSMITLGWLKSDSSRWKTFVANRVVEISSHDVDNWKYVKSEENPADCGSRGIMPGELEHHPLWFSGPKWLKNDPSTWEEMEINEPELEQKTIAVNLVRITHNDTIERASSWFRLIRVTARCRRFKTKEKGRLSLDELRAARLLLVKQCQSEVFAREIHQLQETNEVSPQSVMVTLNPFLDEEGILRVGGRLANSNLPFEQKHPIILPTKHQLTELVVSQMHKDTLHGGPQLMNNLLRKRYWIIQGKRVTSNAYKNCVTCKRFNGKGQKQIMGDLPKARVTLERSFLHCGIDYAGPVQVKVSKLRNAVSMDGYIAVFVCMATKAIHLEIVSDQTTEAFLAAFERFVARRGLPIAMYSDNGRNFVGAANKLERNFLRAKNMELADLVSNRQIQWNFIPPNAPNFGGLWERGVRSTKDHLKRTMKTAKLTFEEYGTVLCQIEACLNSRPLCIPGNDPEQLNVLTPGHFLIGDALLAVPQPTLLDNAFNNTRRWNYLQLLQQQFWRRWHVEYLTELQQRQKWSEASPNLHPGDMVLVKDEDLPPRSWLIGKISKIHPGDDGKVRVATLQVYSGTPPKLTELKRPIRKLCPLVTEPMEDKPVKKPTQDTTRRSYKLRSKMMKPANLALAILALIFLFGGGMAETVMDKRVTTKAFDNDAGIYFENLGRANVIRSEWNILVHFNLQKHNYEAKTLNEIISDLWKTCNKLDKPSEIQCSNIVGILSERMREVSKMNSLLKMNKHGMKRLRRAAPLNIVGWAAHELFGIMDESSAEKWEEKVKKLNENDAYLAELIRNQTSAMDLTLNLFKSSNEESNKTLDKVTTALATLANGTDMNRKRNEVLMHLQHVELLVSRLEQVQENVVNMLTDLQSGHVSSYLFKPTQFQHQLAMVNDHLPNSYKLPVDPQHDLRSFYKLMRGTMRVTEKHILLLVVIPLVSIAEFQIYNIIPIPTSHQTDRISIIPESKYLLMNLQKDTFYQMNEKEYDTCLQIQEAMIICRLTHPMNKATSSRSLCERELLSKKSTLNSHCKYRITPEEEIWVQLHKQNRWIYNLRDESTLNVVCVTKDSDSVDTILLKGSGIMKIPAGCEVSHQGVTLVGEFEVTTYESVDFYPSSNLSNLVLSSSTQLDIENMTSNHNEQIHQIYSQLQEIKGKSNRFQQMQQQTFKTFGFGTGTIIIIIGIGITLWYYKGKLMQRCTQGKRNNGDVAIQLEIQDGRQLTEPRSSGDSHDQTRSVSSDEPRPEPRMISAGKRPEAGGCPIRT